MNERIFRFKFNEVKKYRIVCSHCRTVIEMPVDFKSRMIEGHCPKCRSYFFEDERIKGAITDIENLFDAVKNIKEVEFEMEFTEE